MTALVASVSSGRQRVVFCLQGSLDVGSVAALSEAATGFDLGAAQTVVVDVRNLSFMDSTGLGALIVFSNTAAAQGVLVEVYGANARVRRLIDMTGLRDRLCLRDPAVADEGLQAHVGPSLIPDPA